MDRNSVIGFGLLILLLIGYVVYNQQSQSAYLEQKRADSIAYAKAHPKPLVDSAKLVAQAQQAADTLNDSLRAAMPPAYTGQAQTVKLENKQLSVDFTTKGAHPTSARLVEYKTSQGGPLYLFNGADNQLSAVLPINNGAVATSDLYYTPSERTEPDGSKTIQFTADMGNGQAVNILYSLPAEGYMLKGSIQLTGMQVQSLPITWQTQTLHTERTLATERQNAQVYYHQKNNDHDYFTINNQEKIEVDEPAHWVGLRMQYFSTAFIADDAFNKVTTNSTTNVPDSNVVAKNHTAIDAKTTNNQVGFRWYIGPNHYKTLRSYKIDLDEMVPLGYGVMSFVKYINKWLIIPIFNTLSQFITNYGVIIMIMTIMIRLILSFFTYKSYLSAAKMRVLKPEIDELRAKYGEDQQKFSMEQMKLFRTAGVNPLGGCLPTLFQLPILFAMYYFFPTSIELRQQPFLWANDLSTYDSIATLPFNIPFYGDHVSLFTLLMTASSLFLALYNRNMTQQDPNNPMLKYMPYIFPFMLIGVFNKMAAALTFYYFFSNMISIAQQFIIQKYIINEKAIHAQIQENKNKPATPSKWQQRLEQMQKSQMDRMQQQPKKK
ncbi:membrane protein insertase YidC [Polluticoccus soli]|uniref:membrane protein insertase YidC n=1 Tax=Polluticoccus soli TaxID=3034150 RepID=UPI0023E0C0F0|nr:membrane protein insertase YidC [Flavipsychrobacter sp. JY13-12]